MAKPQWLQVVDHLKSFRVGTYEGYTKSGGYDNNTQFGRQYGENRVSWCVIFEWCVYDDCKLNAIVPKVDNVNAFSSWARARGQWSEYPSVGAWVNFNNGQHTEMVTGFDSTYVYTKGGNTNNSGSSQGDGVYEHKNLRASSKVTGYFAPRFPDKLCPPTADPNDPRGGKKLTKWMYGDPLPYGQTAPTTTPAKPAPKPTTPSTPTGDNEMTKEEHDIIVSLKPLINNLMHIDRTNVSKKETHAAGYYLAVGEGHAHSADDKLTELTAKVDALTKAVAALAKKVS